MAKKPTEPRIESVTRLRTWPKPILSRQKGDRPTETNSGVVPVPGPETLPDVPETEQPEPDESEPAKGRTPS